MGLRGQRFHVVTATVSEKAKVTAAQTLAAAPGTQACIRTWELRCKDKVHVPIQSEKSSLLKQIAIGRRSDLRPLPWDNSLHDAAARPHETTISRYPSLPTSSTERSQSRLEQATLVTTAIPGTVHAIVAQAAASALQDHFQRCSDQQHHQQLRGLLNEHACLLSLCTLTSMPIITVHVC